MDDRHQQENEITGDMIIGPYYLPLKLILAAEDLLVVSKERPQDIKIEEFVTYLSLLERIIDASRGMVMPGSSEKFPEHKKQVELHLGMLRVQIKQLASSCDQEKLREALRNFSDQLLSHYSSPR